MITKDAAHVSQRSGQRFSLSNTPRLVHGFGFLTCLIGALCTRTYSRNDAILKTLRFFSSRCPSINPRSRRFLSHHGDSPLICTATVVVTNFGVPFTLNSSPQNKNWSPCPVTGNQPHDPLYISLAYLRPDGRSGAMYTWVRKDLSEPATSPRCLHWPG